MKVLFSTASVCPVCKKRVPASYVQNNDIVQLKQFCPEHGSFSSDIWRGNGFQEWCGDWRPEAENNPDCPTLCGLCEKHHTQTCCAILDITSRCNLNCSFCFADGGKGKDMPFEEVCRALDDIYEKGLRFVQLSGGEPTMHPDLPAIAEYAAKKGFFYIQINTNGVKLAESRAYNRELSDAGVSCIFLQFDGMSDEVFMKVRGEKLLDKKKQAIRNCNEVELGVMLVPTIIPEINENEIGKIIKFAFENSPAIRGVHFQPVTYTGRFDAGEHFTLPEMLDAIEMQTDGLITREQIMPSACNAPLCGFHAEFRRINNKLSKLSMEGQCCSCGSDVDGSVSQNHMHLKNRWTRIRKGNYEEGSFAALTKQINDQSFCISGMMFQDLKNIDLGRTMRCSAHVYKDGKVIPFCVYHNGLSQY